MKYRLKHVVEYGAVRGLACLVQNVPYRVALALGWGVAWLSHRVFRFRIDAARWRIRDVFKDQYSEPEVRRIAWLSWRNFIFSIIGLIRIPVTTPNWVLSVVDSAATEQGLLTHLKTGKGAIIATIHMGAWEMAALASLAHRVPLFSLAAKQKNPLVDEFMNQMRAGTGFETLLRNSSVLKGIIRRIRDGKVLAILPDGRARSASLPVQFLGQTAHVAAGMALIARQTGAPIYPCVITRIGWDRHRYRVFDPVWPDPSVDKRKDWQRMTQAVFDAFDPCIRTQPEQWFWFNKRWMLEPFKAADLAVVDSPDQEAVV